MLGYSKSGTGVYGISASSTAGIGVYGSSRIGGSFETTGVSDAIHGVTTANGNALFMTDTNNKASFQVTGDGTVIYAGRLETFARLAGGGTARSYGPNATQPTSKTSEQRNSSVAPASFGSIQRIEPASSYHVFVTPNGENA